MLSDATSSRTRHQDGTESADRHYMAFLEAFPQYPGTWRIDQLRATDYQRLDRTGHVYLDYTGGGLYAESQLRRHYELLSQFVFGNPHSHNPTSMAASEVVEATRASVLQCFRANPDEYDVVFTANASGALKLVGESYPWASGAQYLLTYDNHNSVNGIREFARRGGARVRYIPVRAPELRIDAGEVLAALDTPAASTSRLFAFPAQSNFSGVQHPLNWVTAARERGWDVLLDAAAFAPTNTLDLSAISPDFVTLSFYKMFGYPTGIGALIARREALGRLRRPWFAGGTIAIASVQGEGWHRLVPGHAGFEDGTVDYLGLPAIATGLRHLSSVGMPLIHTRVMALAGWLLTRLREARHSNGTPLARIFGPATTEHRGGTVAFLLLSPTGEPYDVNAVDRLASRRMISIRTGCFCNPGDGEVAHDLSRTDMEQCFDDRMQPASFEGCLESIRTRSGKTPNTLRASLGIASNFSDVEAFLAFIESLKDQPVGVVL